jgi:hypothetical protein
VNREEVAGLGVDVREGSLLEGFGVAIEADEASGSRRLVGWHARPIELLTSPRLTGGETGSGIPVREKQ